MKNLYKLMLVAFAVGSMLFQSCETVELEQVDNPNALSPDQADPNLLLNAIQRAYVTNMVTFNDRSSELTRIDYMFGRDYFNNYGPATLDGVWTRFYSSNNLGNQGMSVNIQNLESLNDDPDLGLDLTFQLGMAKTLQAHQLMLLVDFLGDIPWSEALNPLEFPNPNVDDDATLYQVALDLLNEAETFFTPFLGDAVPADAIQDFFYNSDPQAWVKLINTLRMRHALTTGDLATFNGIAANPASFISETADDFQFAYGTQLLNPNTQHQDYFADYTNSGAGIYQSMWLMYTMQGIDKSNGNDDDPRIRYYYFRQAGCTPGASCDPDGDGQFLSCSLETPPIHLGGFPFCFLEDGYWGRNHMDDDGTPPDNFLRTAVGVYPAGGLIDDDKFRNGSITLNTDTGLYEFTLNTSDDSVNLNRGAAGQGIEPFILASYVDFWRAEVALGSGQVGNAAAFVRAGMEKSIAKVSSFTDPEFTGALLDDTTFNPNTGDIINASLSTTLIPDQTYIDDYVNDIVALVNDTSDDSWNALAEQYFIAMYGGGSDAFNFYRRTGYPTTVDPGIEPNPGVFPRTFLYPNADVIANPNITQRTDNATQVFWDTKPAGPAFPPAN